MLTKLKHIWKDSQEKLLKPKFLSFVETESRGYNRILENLVVNIKEVINVFNFNCMCNFSIGKIFVKKIF